MAAVLLFMACNMISPDYICLPLLLLWPVRTCASPLFSCCYLACPSANLRPLRSCTCFCHVSLVTALPSNLLATFSFLRFTSSWPFPPLLLLVRHRFVILQNLSIYVYTSRCITPWYRHFSKTRISPKPLLYKASRQHETFRHDIGRISNIHHYICDNTQDSSCGATNQCMVCLELGEKKKKKKFDRRYLPRGEGGRNSSKTR